jgi:multiple antibiotic resistance protein
MTTLNVLTVFITIFTIVDPFGLIPIFLAFTGHLDKKARRSVVIYASFIALASCYFFLFLGKKLLSYLGLSFESFYIAGGILLFLVALDMIFSKPKRTRQPNQQEECYKYIAVFPIAIPMLAGPGTIATVIMFASDAKHIYDYLIIAGAILFSLLVAVIVMIFSDAILKILKRTGLNVIDKMMGIILAAMSVQFIINALIRLGVIKG